MAPNAYRSVSLVDGYNLPMAITNSANCPVADCPVDLGPNCECFQSTRYFRNADHCVQAQVQSRVPSTRRASLSAAKARVSQTSMATRVRVIVVTFDT